MNLGKNGANGHGREAKAVLKNIDLTIPAGSTVAIIGPTGSGKTTLAALIARLWDAPEGTILIDGRPIREWPVETLRRAIGYVPQDTYLFSESVGENIAFGLEKFAEQQVREAAAIASLDGEVQDFAGQVPDDGGRARSHTLRRAETADGYCTCGDSRSADSDSG